MKIHSTRIPDLVVVESRLLRDERGFFSRLFCESELLPIIGNRVIVQINQSYTRTAGAVRGLHYQLPPNAEMKMVRCLKGKVWDVAVDLRSTSNSYMHWHAQELTPENAYMMVIPEGFAHGFQALEADSELLYLHTALYSPDFETGLRHDDPSLGIVWPLAVTDISKKDLQHPFIGPSFKGVRS